MANTKTSTELLEQYQKSHSETSNGYWRLVDSAQLDEYRSRLTSDEAESFVPFAISVFGEILALEKDKYVNYFNTPSGTSEVIASGLKFFFEDLEEESFVKQHFRIELFHQAKEKYGLLAPHQCYGFVPLLALGGTESVSHLEICDLSVHLELLL